MANQKRLEIHPHPLFDPVQLTRFCIIQKGYQNISLHHISLGVTVLWEGQDIWLLGVTSGWFLCQCTPKCSIVSLSALKYTYLLFCVLTCLITVFWPNNWQWDDALQTTTGTQLLLWYKQYKLCELNTLLEFSAVCLVSPSLDFNVQTMTASHSHTDFI